MHLATTTFPIKHNTCIHGNIAGIMQGTINYVIVDDWCFSHEEITELVRQVFSRGKLWGIYISVTSYQVPS